MRVQSAKYLGLMIQVICPGPHIFQELLVQQTLPLHFFEGTLVSAHRMLKLNATRHTSAPSANMLESSGHPTYTLTFTKLR